MGGEAAAGVSCFWTHDPESRFRRWKRRRRLVRPLVRRRQLNESTARAGAVGLLGRRLENKSTVRHRQMVRWATPPPRRDRRRGPSLGSELFFWW